jgi:hypothetical protein
MILEHGSKQYHVGDLDTDLVAETASHRLYLCSQNGGRPQNLLQVATDLAHNGELDRASYILEILLHHAEELESEYARVKTDPKDMLNYQLCFPDLADSFVPADQGDRRVNILGFRGVDDVRSMVPLYNIVHRDKRRVDLRTSVWIAGKLLKTLVFAHDASISVGDISLGNVLIQPDQHYVVVFDWANARQHTDGISQDVVRDEIRSAATTIIEILGGMDEHSVPDDDGEQYERYNAHLAALASNGARTVEEAHRMFYTLADDLWPREFYPFTTLPLAR